jgi:hypothetical protein
VSMPSPQRSVSIASGIMISTILLSAAQQPAGTQTLGTFSVTGAMTTLRFQHSAMLLMDGRVLLAGGYGSEGEGLASAEIYDPATGAFSPTGGMTSPRRMHSATLLPGGRVLIVGGYSSANALGSAELYDPASSAFIPTGSLTWSRGGHTAILLASGKVLILGGYGGSAAAPGLPNVAPAELYDSATGMFTSTGPYAGAGGCDFCPPSVLPADGRALFDAQYPAQLYDPGTGLFSPTGGLLSEQSAATLLMNGKVLFAGGEDDFGRYSTAEIYDPAIGAFASTGEMVWTRYWHSVTLLPNGLVLAAGGETDGCSGGLCTFSGTLPTAELYDPMTGTFTATGSMNTPREAHTATLLNDGRVLVAGGVSYGGIGPFFGGANSAELYTPPLLVPSPTLFSVSGEQQGAIWHAVTGKIASSDNAAVAGEALAMYTANLAEGGIVPPQVSVGGKLAEVLYFGDAPGYPGYYQVNFVEPDGVAPGSSVTVRLIYLGRASNAVTISAQ